MSARPTTARPQALPPAAAGGIVTSALLVGVGVVALQHFAVARGWTSGTSWTDATIESLDGLGASVLTTGVGVVAVLLGLAIVWLALKPARKTHLQTPVEGAEVWISRSALRRMAEQAAERTGAVEEAEADVSRRSVKVTVRTLDPDCGNRVRENVESALAGLTTATVAVKTKEVRDDA